MHTTQVICRDGQWVVKHHFTTGKCSVVRADGNILRTFDGAKSAIEFCEFIAHDYFMRAKTGRYDWFADGDTTMLLSSNQMYGIAVNQRLNDGSVFLFEVGEGG